MIFPDLLSVIFPDVQVAKPRPSLVSLSPLTHPPPPVTHSHDPMPSTLGTTIAIHSDSTTRQVSKGRGLPSCSLLSLPLLADVVRGATSIEEAATAAPVRIASFSAGYQSRGNNYIGGLQIPPMAGVEMRNPGLERVTDDLPPGIWPLWRHRRQRARKGS